MTRRLPVLLIALVAGCSTCPDIPDMPDAPQLVRVPVTEYVVPEWLVKPLPEDAPRANTVEEATRLACVRLGTIHVANCRARLGDALRTGKAVDAGDIAACETRAVSKCEVKK
ncbi:hypothetical protein [Luteimonas notoginsengisoli]|uniref:Lipoprotein n=1 Tax=Luteimonas notoginsengisoli TaxID=1578200 RepID=A0ABV7UQT0_9GAMM